MLLNARRWRCLFLALFPLLCVGSLPAAVPFSVENFTAVGKAHFFVQGGIPLPRGYAAPEMPFHVTDSEGIHVEAEVNVTAFWPDGSVKWVLVRMQPDITPATVQHFELHTGGELHPATAPIANQDERTIYVDNGALRFTIDRTSPNLLSNLEVNHGDGWVAMLAGADSARLFVEVEHTAPGSNEQERIITRTRFDALHDQTAFSAVLEEATGTVAVIRLDGVHATEGGEIFAPYTVRLYSYRNDTRLRLHHTFVFDGDAQEDRIRAIGVELKAAPESVSGYTLSDAQGPGHATRYVEDPSLPAWRRGWLAQNSADAFTIRKVIDPVNNAPIRVGAGTRAQGWGRLETGQGSIGVAVRNFWQEYPKAIAADAVDRTLTAYFYSPYGDPLDLRRYSDWGYHALYEAGAAGPGTPATPYDHEKYNATGISKSSDLLLEFAPPAEPAEGAAATSVLFQRPPLLRAAPAWMASTGVFGHFGAIPEAGPGVAHYRAVMDLHIDEQARNRWYGFIDYGDVMHSFDPVRDQWRFDEGGYAWLNNEGQIACSYWTAYLATGDERVYRFAEAMTRHVQDVDMYQTGPFAGCGMRHNVNHWGCTNRERRMTIAQNKRIYHFLSGDEHTRDQILFSYEMLPKGEGPAYCPAMNFSVGATALLYLWESTGDPHYGEVLQKCAEVFGSNPIKGYGFPAQFALDLSTGEGSVADDTPMLADYFLTFFGPLRVLMEISDLTGNEVITNRVLKWATLLLEPEDRAAALQLHFAKDIVGAYCHMHAAAFAFRNTGDARYLEIVLRALENPPVTFEARGGDGTLDAPRHRAMTANAFQSNSLSIALYNFPYGYAVLD